MSFQNSYNYCSLYPYFCSSDQSLLFFKFKLFILNIEDIINIVSISSNGWNIVPILYHNKNSDIA